MRIKPLSEHVGAEIGGVNLAADLSDDIFEKIDDAYNRYSVLVFRDQPLDQDQQIAFARAFGTLDIGLRRATRQPHRFKYEELIDISNVAADGSIAGRDSRRVAPVSSSNSAWRSSVMMSSDGWPARQSM